MIESKNLYFKYEEDYILRNVNLKIIENSFTAIIGANGSGKTTLAKHFNALLIPAKGDILIDGINTKTDEFNARIKVGFVFQNFEEQIIHSIVEDDVAFGLENLGFDENKIKRIVYETLSRLKIMHLAKQNVNTLSQGQKQLVALAGVIAMNPKYVVFDEPTTNLDEKNKKNIMKIIHDLNKKEKRTIILITNILDDLKYASDVIAMKTGRTIFSGKKSKLRDKILRAAELHD